MPLPPKTLIWILEPSAPPRPLTTISVTDRGFRYGMSVFESIAFHRGDFRFLAEHLNRLTWACTAAGFPEPDHLTPGHLHHLLREIPEGGEGMLRLYVTAGDGEVVTPVTAPRVYALYEEMGFPTDATREIGFKVSISRVPFTTPLGGWKTGNYWPHVQALAEAHRQDCKEALVFNASGAMVSASMANVFLVIDGRLCTPALECGARNGVVREWVRRVASAEEFLLTTDDVARVEECFLTNSRLGIMPVSHLDGRELPSRAFSEMLAIRYRNEVFGA